MTSGSFRSWLITEIKEVLNRTTPVPPHITWCDQRREWTERLEAAGPIGGFDLWAEPENRVRALPNPEQHVPLLVLRGSRS